MVPADQGDAIGIAHFQAEEQEEGFERVEATVDKVAHEQVVCVRDVAAHAKQFHQVVELAVDVAAYRDRRVHRDHIAFFYEQFAGLVAEFSDLGFWDGAARAQLRDGSEETALVDRGWRSSMRTITKMDLLVEVAHRRADEMSLGLPHMGVDCADLIAPCKSGNMVAQTSRLSLGVCDRDLRWKTLSGCFRRGS